MPGIHILNDDGKDYDNRKVREKRDRSFFSCDETWEVAYLVSKIRKHHSFPEAAIRDAVTACCRSSTTRGLQTEFIHSVMKTLADCESG